MFKLLFRVISFPENRVFLGKPKHCEMACNWTRSIVKMQDPWPVLEKRKRDVEDKEDGLEKKPRIKKKMYALLLAYCGHGYLGLQRNNSAKTIEEELMKALRQLDIVNDEEFRKQQLVNFQRAARTDKNVSAIRQVVNLSMREGVTPEEINEHLPEEIRVLSVKRVTKSFNSKNTCDSRTYSYTCPSFAFAHKSITPSEDFRIDDETFEKLNLYSKHYIGTHNFCNFTSGRKPFDPSCKRLILEAEWQKPVISDGLELIMFLVKGQSFMLHQIRKMVGTLMAICRGHVDADYINTAFDPKVDAHLPTAPGIGLLLEQVHYNWYNKKYGEGGFHEKLDFADVEELVNQFRIKHIYPVLIEAEKNGKSMLDYIQVLDSHYVEYHHGETKTEGVPDVPENISDSKSEVDEIQAVKTETVQGNSTSTLNNTESGTKTEVGESTSRNTIAADEIKTETSSSLP